MQKTLKLVGRYNTFSNTYAKARLYFTVSEDVVSCIEDIYILSKAKSKISINGSIEMNAEVPEFTCKGGKLTMTIEIQSDQKSVVDIAKYAFDRTVNLSVSFDDDKCDERVSNAFYSKLVKTINRMASALGMATPMELKEAIDSIYGYTVPINSNMLLSDAEQLFVLLRQFAEQELPGFMIDIESGTDSFILKRLQLGKCAICDSDMTVVENGVPLCIVHIAEAKKTTWDKFKKKHKL